MTVEMLNKMVAEGKLKRHHSAYFQGYVSRKIDGIVEPYNGRFGKGYALRESNWSSTRYSWITYFVEV